MIQAPQDGEKRQVPQNEDEASTVQDEEVGLQEASDNAHPDNVPGHHQSNEFSATNGKDPGDDGGEDVVEGEEDMVIY